jgi:hypothetical protein
MIPAPAPFTHRLQRKGYLMKRILSLALLCAATTLTAQTTSPWNGTWKLDRAKSHLTGTSFTLSKGANEMWTVNAGPISFTYAYDGKPHPLGDKDHTILATFVDAHTARSTFQTKGKTTAIETDLLSPDGNTISDVTVNNREDGSTYITKETNIRTGPGQGFSGVWTSTQASSSSDTPMTITVAGDTITFASPAEKYTVTARLDGTPATPVSPDMIAGATVSYKQVSATRIDYSTSINGKKISEGYDELSPNGHSYTSVTWLAGKESEKTTDVYVKL